MKKLLPIIFLILIIPQIAFASWWNPFSWNIFRWGPSKTEVLENRVKELEGKLQTNSTTNTPTTTAPVIKKETKKVIPDNSEVIQAQVRAQMEAELKAKADYEALIYKQKADEEARIEAIKIQQARDRANEEAREAQLLINAQVQKSQEKQEALDVVNLKIANLNAKYAQDMKDCNIGGGTVSGALSCKNAKTNRYTDDYNALMAEWQFIMYSN